MATISGGHHSLGLVEQTERSSRLQSAFPPFIPGIKTATYFKKENEVTKHRKKPALSNEQQPSLKWGTHTKQEMLLITNREEKKKREKVSTRLLRSQTPFPRRVGSDSTRLSIDSLFPQSDEVLGSIFPHPVYLHVTFLISADEIIKCGMQAAVMLRAWEIVMEKEKEERHSKLREKVNLQHHLMDRNEEYFQQRKIAKFKLQNQKLEDERKAKREMISDLRQHVNKALKKSRRLLASQQKTPQETVRSLNVSTCQIYQDELQCSTESEQEITARIPTTTIIPFSHPKPESPRNSIEPKTEFDTQERLFTHPENKILQLLGIGNHSQANVKIEDLWMGLKAHADKELHPFEIHLRNLKKKSTPSVKECLEMYRQPVQLDYYTGKAVPLTKSLSTKRHISPPPMHYALKLSRSSADFKSQCGSKMAERMRSNSNHEELQNNANWFVVSKPVERPTSAPGKIRTTMTSECRSMNVQYLKADGRIVSSIKKERSVARTQGKRGTSDTPEPSSGNWEPLSLTALGDYSSVQSRLVSGDGHFKHGRVELWKPHI